MIARIRKNRKAISPVIATVILVAVAITIAISVAYWMGGIAGMYTTFEKIEITTAYASAFDPNVTYPDGGWTLTIVAQNTGSADTTIDNIFINMKPLDNWQGVTVGGSTSLSVALRAGEKGTIRVDIDADGSNLQAGSSLDLKLHTASGNEYPKFVQLP